MLCLVSGIGCAFYEFVYQLGGIAVWAAAAGDDQDLFHDWFPFLGIRVFVEVLSALCYSRIIMVELQVRTFLTNTI